MHDIRLSREEAEQIYLFGRGRRFADGYAYISSIIAQHPEFDRSTAFWFEKARSINMDIRSDPADIYIRSISACGLRWDGVIGNDRIANARMIQGTSDNIAAAVLAQVSDANAITSVNVFLNQDIVGALAAGQTIGGWGGAFYYWNAPFTSPAGQITTVGEAIRSNPAELEKFIACNAAAASDAIWLTRLPGLEPSPSIPGRADANFVARAKLLFDGLAVNGQAQAPQWAKDEIRARVIGAGFGRPLAGPPDRVGDFVHRRGGWVEQTTWPGGSMEGEGAFAAPTAVTDPAVLAQLDARRAARLGHRSFRPATAY